MTKAQELQLAEWKHRLGTMALKREVAKESHEKQLAAIDAEEARVKAAIAKAEKAEAPAAPNE